MAGKKALFTKQNFLTIPDAPNYEINGYFQIRNKKTGKKLKKKKRVDRPCSIVTVWHDGKQVKRDVQSFYRQAVTAILEPQCWYPVKSLRNQYEINGLGEVRNARTKKILKPVLEKNCIHYVLSIDNKSVCRRRAALLNEVFETNIPRKKRPIQVILRKDGLSWYFKSKAAATRFLTSKVFYCKSMIENRLCKCEKEVYGYSVTYM